jgi:hypothetical protein
MRASRSGSAASSHAVRASDAERDQAIDELRERFAEGRLSQDSFVHRVDAALRAREQGELARLLADLPAMRPMAGSVLGRLARAGHAARSRAAAIIAIPQPPALVLPRGTQDSYTIGRDQACDLVLADLTVSRRHAGLHRDGGGWLLDDQDSTNGTMLNGWRVTSPVAVRVGDTVSFGSMTFKICEDR